MMAVRGMIALVALLGVGWGRAQKTDATASGSRSSELRAVSWGVRDANGKEGRLGSDFVYLTLLAGSIHSR